MLTLTLAKRAARAPRAASPSTDVAASGCVERPARPHVERESRSGAATPACTPHRGGQRDHGAVVGAQRQLRVVHARAARGARRVQLARSSAFAPTPPATTSRCEPGLLQRPHRLLHQHLDDRGLRRRGQVGARSCSQTLAPSLRSCVITAVFSPANEKSRLPLCSSGRGSVERSRDRRTRPAAPAPARPDSRAPCSLADLSNASPAASSIVSPSMRVVPRPRPPASAACGRPRPAARRTGTRGGSADRNGDSRWPSRWCTPSTGRSSAAASAAGDAGPDQQRAGQARARACRPRDRRRRATQPASSSTCRASGSTRRMWSRDASSGTTPP